MKIESIDVEAAFNNARELINLKNAVERKKDAQQIDVHDEIKNAVVT